MSRRTELPGADTFFGPRPKQTQPAPAPVEERHVKVSLYLPASMVADMDGYRAELRADACTIDRGRLIREAYRIARGTSELSQAVRGEERA